MKIFTTQNAYKIYYVYAEDRISINFVADKLCFGYVLHLGQNLDQSL